MKYTIATILATLAINASALEIKEIAIPAVCTESKEFYKQLGDYKTIMTYSDKATNGADLSDKMLASKTKNAVFIVRENHEINGICVLAMFDLDKTVKTKDKTL